MGDLTRPRPGANAARAVGWFGACCIASGLVLAVGGCGSGVGCPGDLKYALLVNVIDEGGAQLCDVVVRAEGPDTGSPQTLKVMDCRHSGGTRAGRYLLVVERDGQQLASDDVTVQSDECGVVTKEVTVTVPDS